MNRSPRDTAIARELKTVERQQAALRRAALRQNTPRWKTDPKIPPSVYNGLQSAFVKAFTLVFDRGIGIIEKTPDAVRQAYAAHARAFEQAPGRKPLRQLRRRVRSDGRRSLVLTTAEGLGLGVLGIGLPDIVLFVGVVLKGVYGIALRYGFDTRGAREQFFVLTLLEAALSRGADWQARDCAVDALLAAGLPDTVDADRLQDQRMRTARAFADDLLLLKFLQGLPLVGIVGGLGNPLCYRRVFRYAELKYRKRYLLSQQTH